MKRSETIFKELKEHMPSTLEVSLFAGILIGFFYLLRPTFFSSYEVFLFESMHMLHIFVSAVATSAIYYKYKQSFFGAFFYGVLGALLVGTLSDVLFPWISGRAFLLETSLHIPLIEEPFLVLAFAMVGSLVGYQFGLFKISHMAHVFFSVFASLFYLLTFSIDVSFILLIFMFAIVFIAVYVPCCISDIVFPIFFIKKPCKNCGHWHDKH